MTPEYLTITDAARALRDRRVSSVELVRASIAQADRLDGAVGMFLQRFADDAIAAARAADAALASDAKLGALTGIPFGVKDIISTSEAPSSAQSLVHEAAWSDGDAVVVQRLRHSGAIVTGKLTTMEFAVGTPDADKPFPIPRNPWDLTRWAGGSSSGSGSAVATGAVLGALGTDTGGSIRIPAAFCGITGLMPTFGRVPKTGCVPLGNTLDHVGPMARSARDCALLLGVLAGHDPSDVTSLDVAVPDYLAALATGADLTGVRIGFDRLSRAAGGYADEALDDALDAALGVLTDLGAHVVDVEVPLYEEITSACMVIMLSEALAYHLPDLRSRWSEYFASTRAVVGSGVFYSGADYVQAQRVRRVGIARLAELYRDVDLVLTPTASSGAPTLEQTQILTSEVHGTGPSPFHTSYWDPLGNPVASIPIGFTADGLPLGMQLAGRPFDEALVLRVADAFQQPTDWHLRLPPIAMVAAA